MRKSSVNKVLFRKILIVEDDPTEQRRYVRLCRELGYQCFGVKSLEQAHELIKKHAFDFALCDLFLDKSGEPLGLDLIRSLATNPMTTCLAMSHSPDIQLFRRSLKLGATGVLKKPLINAEEIEFALDQARQSKLAQKRQRQMDSNTVDEPIVNTQTRKLIEVIVKHPKLPCVIYGETGTGKEAIARLIHKKRMANEGEIPFVAINCALLNSELADSELFGHRRGAFSGASSDKEGLIGEADQGILFLDEIHCLAISSQEKLLRVLENGTYRPLGDQRERVSNFQIIAASSRNLDDCVESKCFYMDLRSRLTGIDISLAPLRERQDDHRALINYFFAKEGVKISEKKLEEFTQAIGSYHWQGNIRQLFQVLRVSCAMADVEAKEPSVTFMPVTRTMLAPGNN